MDIFLPSRFDKDELVPFFAYLEAARHIPEVHVHFSTLEYSLPTAMLVAGSKLREWVMFRRNQRYLSYSMGIDSRKPVHSYLMHLGFFDFIYMNEGNTVGQARGSNRYLPITRITKPMFDANNFMLQNWYEDIKEESRRLAGLLVGSYDDTENLRVYSYAIREIIRNVFEHSEVQECYICGQRWANGSVEVVIVDEGVGISNTIRQAYPVEDDSAALALALEAGISRTNRLQDGQENTFDNSGFGLFILSNLAASFGWFAIGSGTARIIGNSQQRINEPFVFSGTFFGMRLLSQPRDFRSVLRDIIEIGEHEAGVRGIARRASGLSRLE